MSIIISMEILPSLFCSWISESIRILTAFASVRFSKSVTQVRATAVGSGNDHNGLVHGHDQASKDVTHLMTRNEVKEAKERKKRKLEIQETMEALIGAVQRDPSLLQKPWCVPLSRPLCGMSLLALLHSSRPFASQNL